MGRLGGIARHERSRSAIETLQRVSVTRASGVAGDKSGGAQARFYKGLIARADRRFDDHLARTEKR